MSFDWTTFALEILNFLVLVWILKRFLYQPVLALLDARQARINAETAHAGQKLAEAEALRLEYESRLAQWRDDCALSRRQLEEDLARERAAALENLKKSLADEAAKARVRDEALAAAREAVVAREAVSAAYTEVAAMLQRLASAELTARLALVCQEDLAVLAEDDLATLRKAAAALDTASPVEIVAAHPLDAETRAHLAQALAKAAGRPLQTVFKESPELIAGLRVVIGECQLHANLADELAFFNRQASHG
jgi:F-type H+-transporting ATPase subunit b